MNANTEIFYKLTDRSPNFAIQDGPSGNPVCYLPNAMRRIEKRNDVQVRCDGDEIVTAVPSIYGPAGTHICGVEYTREETDNLI